ncbi:MAG: NUDIX domain-containing protein [Candidatus Micrarchaeota archaeon]|nr:NUDIX domain-containing protein [Candidatus Micrarchaeota archaeon]
MAAPVLGIVAVWEKKILLLKRGSRVANYTGKWSGITGFIDELAPVREKVLEELREEISASKDDVAKLVVGDPYKIVDDKIGKTWYVCPVLVELRKGFEVKLDWEHTDYRWVDPSEINGFDTTPGLEKSIGIALSLAD